ncbi:MAG: 7TM domain-containing protein, partial [bacterium]|nr:7TM domain-containing protein [bacterium]
VVGTLFRMVLRRVRLSYVPRLAIVLTLVSFAILGLLAIGAYTNQTTFVALSIFPILIMVALAEQFVAAQIEQGFLSAVLLTAETLVLSIGTYYLVSYDPFQSLILAYPELILLTIVINIVLGRWTGLRLIEYYRFRQVRRFAKLP